MTILNIENIYSGRNTILSSKLIENSVEYKVEKNKRRHLLLFLKRAWLCWVTRLAMLGNQGTHVGYVGYPVGYGIVLLFTLGWVPRVPDFYKLYCYNI